MRVGKTELLVGISLAWGGVGELQDRGVLMSERRDGTVLTRGNTVTWTGNALLHVHDIVSVQH